MTMYSPLKCNAAGVRWLDHAVHQIEEGGLMAASNYRDHKDVWKRQMRPKMRAVLIDIKLWEDIAY